MKIVALGTAGASVTSDRDNSFFLVDLDEELILLDCAGNPAGKCLASGNDPSRINLVLLTHLHIDHCYGLPALLSHMFLAGRTQEITIAVPSEDLLLLQDQLKVHQLFPIARTFPVKLIAVINNPSLLIDSNDRYKVYAIPAMHSRESRSYRITESQTGKSVVFTGDTKPNPLMTQFAYQADLLIHECSYLAVDADLAHSYGHSTTRDAAMTASVSDVKRLALTHFDLKKGETADQFASETAAFFEKDIYILNDFDVIEI